MVALSLYRGAEKEGSYELRNADEFYVIIGTQLGLFLCNMIFPFAYLFGHKPGSLVSHPHRNFIGIVPTA